MAKIGKASTKTPLEQLMGGGVVRMPIEATISNDRVPYIELIDEGWTVEAPDSSNPHWAGVAPKEKLMVTPLDESDRSFISRVHEQAHVTWTPSNENLDVLARKAELTPDVLNAFEDGRVNAKIVREVPSFKEAIETQGFPLSVDVLRSNVEMTRKFRTKVAGTDAEENVLSDEEIRAMGACLMAASHVYSETFEKLWRQVGEACGLSKRQIKAVEDLCLEFPEISFEEMVERIRQLMDNEILDPMPSAMPVIPVTMDGDGEDGESNVEDEDDEEGAGGGRAGEGELGWKTTRIDTGVDHKLEEAEGRKEYTITSPSTTEKKVELAKTATSSKWKEQRNRALHRAAARVSYFDPMKANNINAYGIASCPGSAITAAKSYDWHSKEATTKAVAIASGKAVGGTRRPEPKEFDAKRADVLTKDFGVTIVEENYLYQAFGGDEFVSRGKFIPSEMEVVEDYPLTEEMVSPMGTPRKLKKHDRVGYMSSAFRAHLDGKVFRRKQTSRKRMPTGSILLDLSGSMRPSSELIKQCLEIAPYAVIGAYAGDDVGSGCFTVVAKDRRSVSQKTLEEIIGDFGGGNSVDYPALEWLALQPMPRIWISDGFACGTPGSDAEHIRMCFQLCRKAGIIRVRSMTMLVGQSPLRNNLRLSSDGKRIDDDEG